MRWGGSGAIPPLPTPVGGLALRGGCHSTASPSRKSACKGRVLQGRPQGSVRLYSTEVDDPQQGARFAAILRDQYDKRTSQILSWMRSVFI